MSAPGRPGAPAGARRVLVAGALLGQPMGGVLRHNRELLPRLARALAARGGELAVLAGATPPALVLPDAARVVPSDVPARPVAARAALEGRALRRELRAARAAGRPYDLVHAAHLPAPRVREPLALLLHDLKALDPATASPVRRILGRLVLARAAARAAAVLVVSAALGDELRAALALDAGRIAVVPNGGDHLPVLPRAEAPAGLLCVGHVEPRKNLAVVLRALALDAELPGLDVVGAERGGEGARLRRLAAELGVAGRVRFLGERGDDDLAERYARAACVVLPSRREGFGIPALEARLAGAPLAVADVPALREVAGDAPAFGPDDPAACARAVRAALARPREHLAASRARARAWTWDAAAEHCLAAWDAAVRTAR